MELHRFDNIPQGLLEVSVEAIDTVLPGSSLIYLKGQKDSPLLVSTLLHGNETTGFYAMQQLLHNYQTSNIPLPRSLLYFIGNVSAAAKGVRHLPEQRDYNRIWSGGESAEHRLAQQVIKAATSYNLFASIDIHNNTGKNPLYGCINKLDDTHKNLAALFSPVTVYFITPREVFSLAFSEHCPSITIECGQSGTSEGIDYVCQYINNILHMEDLKHSSQHNAPHRIYHTVARIKVPIGCTLGFGRKEADKDLSFIEKIDNINFTELAAGTLLGWRHNESVVLSVIDEDGIEKGHEYLTYANDEIRTKKPFIPSMFTRDTEVIHQDCFGYIMEYFVKI